jgi:PAS domain S-box-containing protein
MSFENGDYQLLNILSKAIFIIDDRRNLVFYNQKAAELAELLDIELQTGVSIFESIFADSKAILEIPFDNVLHGHGPSVIETYVARKDKKMYLELGINKVERSGSNGMHILLEVHDITPEKIFQHKILSVARELEHLIENANAVIIGTDARGYITVWNQVAAQIIGYSKNESYTKKLQIVLGVPDENRALLYEMANALAGNVVNNFHLEILDRHGKNIVLLVNITPRRNPQNEIVGLLFVAQDITELTGYKTRLEMKVEQRTEALKEALEKEKELVRIKDRFVSIASHEFKVPLSAILKNTLQMRDVSRLTHTNIEDSLLEIERQVKQMKNLVDDLLTVERTETKITATKKRLEIIGFFRSLVDELQRSSTTHTICSKFEVSSCVLEADEKLLRNIFINLLSNAIKFSPGKEKVLFSIFKTQTHLVTEIQDYGIGIPPADMEKIFEPFNRGTNVEHIDGTGLGLSIVKRAVNISGGELRMQSSVGSGTKFTVDLRL